ncbi:hypothetical protein SAMN05216359_11311 [Roseateles sp. YR242]|uniref:hypothetical protein n=1 Tax=Roseateles sp. YR242 TaxID=1855305 RepID=UPI0008D05B6F|nr:hypothetical protein [Roseateles sp. YR242]SEL65257.1 hypothetical protein SAMN05216359_11311 [Roseateles sp. YR242]
MRPILVDFAPQRVWTAPLIAWAVVCAVGTAALCLKAGVAWEQRQAAIQQAESSAQALATLESKLRDARAALASQGPPPYARDALEAARVARFPTQAVLRALESTAVDGIRLSSIALQPAQRSAEVGLEFSDYKTLLKFVEQLNEGEPQTPWVLVRAQESGQKRQAVVRFLGR